MATKKKAEPKRFDPNDNPVVKKIMSRTEKYANSIQEIVNDSREFPYETLEGTRRFRIVFPDLNDQAEIANTYSREWGRLISDSTDLKTEEEIMETLGSRGLWGKEKNDRMEALRERLTRLTGLIFNTADKMTKAELKKQTDDYEATEKELQELSARLNSYMLNSVENRAQDIRMRDQLWRCVYEIKVDEEEKETVELVWANLEELNSEKDRVLLITLMNQAITYWQGVPEDFLDDSPETQDGENDTQ